MGYSCTNKKLETTSFEIDIIFYHNTECRWRDGESARPLPGNYGRSQTEGQILHNDGGN